MATLDEWFARYGEAHRHPVNEAIHLVCVPAITWSVVALAMLVAVALTVAACVHAPDSIGAIAAAVFVVAWIGQFAGHRIEGRKPAFLDDVKFLLIGPACVLGFVMRRLHLRH